MYSSISIDGRGTGESAKKRVERHQSVRLRRLGLSCISYALQIALVAVIACLGSVTAEFVLGYAASQVVIVALFYVAFRTGWNLRSREPNLTLVQVLAPALPGFILLYQLDAAESQAALVLTTIVPLLYGTLDLTMAGFLVAVTVYSVGYLGVIFSHGLFSTDDGILLHNWVLLASLLIVMPQIVLLSSLVNRLRRKLRERNDQVHEAMSRISAMAVRDELTGLYNRRWLMEILERERLIAQRRGYSFCIGMIDVDHFKAINDAHGHAVGDRVLRELGQYMVDEVRDIDGFGRFGGEEFLWIVPDTDLDSALGGAERLRRRAADMVFPGDDGARFSVTLSIGIAQNDHTLQLRNDTLLRRADKALYKAKEQGRNQVVYAPTDTSASHTITQSDNVELAG